MIGWFRSRVASLSTLTLFMTLTPGRLSKLNDSRNYVAASEVTAPRSAKESCFKRFDFLKPSYLSLDMFETPPTKNSGGNSWQELTKNIRPGFHTTKLNMFLFQVILVPQCSEWSSSTPTLLNVKTQGDVASDNMRGTTARGSSGCVDGRSLGSVFFWLLGLLKSLCLSYKRT